MTTRSRLIEIQKLVNKTQGLLDELVNAQPKPPLGRPPQPRYRQRIERGIWDAWERLKAKGEFTAAQARKIAEKDDSYLERRSDPAYSSILSRWARDGYIQCVEEGSGPRPSVYRIPD